MMTIKVDQKILPQLWQVLVDDCPTVEEARKRVKESLLQSPYPELAEKFDLLPRVSVTNLYRLDDEKPIFELRDLDFCLDPYEVPIFSQDEEIEKKRTITDGIFERIKGEIENEGKLPIVIETPGRIIILDNCLDAGTVFGLPQEVKDQKRSLMKPFKNARTIG